MAISDFGTIGILGGGLSGVVMGIQLKMAGIDDFVIYDKQDDVGGTWVRNTYPGLHCDMPSHLYCYSFEPNPDFSMVYAGQPEIQAYIRSCAEKYGLLDHLRLGTTVETATYSEEGYWSLEIAGQTAVRHRVLVSATGGLTEPHYPRIEGRLSFAGPQWHSGSWRHDVDLAGKRVAVIGSAASAVQVVPSVAGQAAEVVVYSRTPNWVVPRGNYHYSVAQKASFATDEGWHRVRRQQWRSSLLWQQAFERNPGAADEIASLVLNQINAAIEDGEVVEALTPSYEPGCKRILVSDDYYPTLAKDHVTLVPHGVTELSENEVVAADGSRTEVDVVIFCTGYKLGSREDGRPAVDVQGRDCSLREALGRAPEAYRSVAIPGFPNYFVLGGINGAPGHAPLFLVSEVLADHILRWIRRLLDEDLTSVEVKPESAKAYSLAIQDELQNMSWAGDCPGWYKDREGRILAFFPGSWNRMRRELRDLHENDYILR
ncbi:MAG: cation diffusion facilitator CzcD-associated flavoprotein CzcO [Acidimicrobiales bacterium]